MGSLKSHSYFYNKGCDPGPPAYSPYRRRLESVNICCYNYKGSTFYSVISVIEPPVSYACFPFLLVMLDVGYVNLVSIISQNPKVTAINSCIEVDLTGQVVSDSIGTRIYSGNEWRELFKYAFLLQIVSERILITLS